LSQRIDINKLTFFFVGSFKDKLLEKHQDSMEIEELCMAYELGLKKGINFVNTSYIYDYLIDVGENNDQASNLS